jgi:DNA modification methylase
MLDARIIVGNAADSLAKIDAGSVRTCVTSPPYWGLRDYGNDGQLGLEPTPQEFVENLCKVFDEVWRVLADDGTVWVNLGDSYFPHGGSRGNKTPAGDSLRGRGNNYQPAPKLSTGDANLKQKDLVGIPWRFAFAMQDRGWYLRQDIIWAKPNPMPESVTDRCTKSHEYIFLLSKKPKYFFDNEAIKEPISEANQKHYAKYSGMPSKTGSKTNQVRNDGGFDATQCGFAKPGIEKRNKRSVWTVPTKAYKEAHFAVYPPALIEPCILAGSAEGDTVLDPFSGSGTTGEVALQNGRNYLGIELNPDYAALSEKRISDAIGLMGKVLVS